MAGRRILFLVLWIGACCFYIAYQQWMAWFLLMVVAALPFFSLLISLPAMLSLRVKPDIPVAVTVGQPQDLAMLYSCALPAPPWGCTYSVYAPLTGEKWSVREARDLPTEHCGALICKQKKGWVLDYLGLFKLPLKQCRERTILVRPVSIPIPNLPSPEEKLHKFWRPKPGGGFSENHELRLYRPGDSIQAIHWKLSAKTGSLILREPMEPLRRRLLVQLDLCGSPEQLDRKLGRLLWLGRQLLEKRLDFELQCLSGDGLLHWTIEGSDGLDRAIDSMLRAAPAFSGTLQDRYEQAAWRYFIGGDADEA